MVRAFWVKLAKFVRQKFLFGDLQLWFDVLLQKLGECLDEKVFVLPELDETLNHVQDVVVVYLGAIRGKES